MPQIRLLQSVAGGGFVAGDAGTVLDVDDDTALIWADGERAELVEFTVGPRTPVEVEVPVPVLVEVPVLVDPADVVVPGDLTDAGDRPGAVAPRRGRARAR